MKIKKFMSIAMLICLGLTLSGCKGSIKNVDKQIDKMKNIVEKEELFEEDYKMIYSLSKKHSGQTNSYYDKNVTIKKSGNRMYIYTKEGSTATNVWVGEENSKYYVYYNDGTIKEFAEITEGEVNSLFLELEKKDIGIRGVYDNWIMALETYKGNCNKKDVKCNIEKNLFGSKVDFEYKDTVGKHEIEIKNGVILEISEEETINGDEVDVEINFEYDDQKISWPSRKEYTYSQDVVNRI